jgi:hypothetical protein
MAVDNVANPSPAKMFCRDMKQRILWARSSEGPCQAGHAKDVRLGAFVVRESCRAGDVRSGNWNVFTLVLGDARLAR